MAEEPIAIVGMAGRFPGANNVEEFWTLLMEKGDAISRVPDIRWRDEQVKETTAKQRATIGGFLKCPVDEFDAKFFGVSPKEAEFTDPQQRMLLEVSWEALEDASVDPHSLNGTSTGIFTGTWRTDYWQVMENLGRSRREFFRAYMGNSFGAGAGRLAFFYGTTGANVATESGCSSSMVAVGLACESLRRKKSNLALACGVNLMLKPFDHDEVSAFCSRDGHCKTFDEAADGFARAEGVGVLVLKRLSDAVKDGDCIRAVIRGYGEGQEGPSRSLGTPTIGVEAMAMELALSNAQVEAKEVSFVEAHGTGTAVGDPMEMSAIAQVYSKGRTTPLLVGSVKTNVGHTESVSGITGIIKTVLALERQVIPPLRSLETLNPKINLSLTPALIPLEPTPWPRNAAKPRIAGVSSFGITGTDTHLILQESPNIGGRQLQTRQLPYDVLALSARTEDALSQLIEKYVEAFRNETLQWGDVTFTANAGRAHFGECRKAFVASDAKDFLRQVERQSNEPKNARTHEKPKVVFLCSGQGSQYPGMAKELYNTSAEFRRIFDQCDETIRKKYSYDIKQALWEEQTQLDSAIYSPLCIFVVTYCVTELWKSWGVVPDVVLGHSMGEYVAAVIAGIANFDTALSLITKRGELVDRLPGGDMIAVNMDATEVTSLLKTLPEIKLEIAAMNSTEQTTLAGTKESVSKFKTYCKNNGLKAHVLNTTHAFHSSMMDPALPELQKWAETISHKPPTCTFISSVDGNVATSLNAEYWVKNMRQPVDFLKACGTLGGMGSDLVCVEVGPQPVLLSLVARNLETTGKSLTLLPSLRRNQSDWRTLMESLASLYTSGVDINWKSFYGNVGASRLPGLPTYPFQRKTFWFEMPQADDLYTSKKKLHPLLHLAFLNVTSSKIFQTALSLDEEEYLKDHKVCGHLIFPAAGYVEMALAAVNSASESDEFRLPQQPLFLRDFIVEAPLGLEDKQTVSLQTVVSPAEANWSSVTFSRQQKMGGKSSWVRHASIGVSNFNTSDDGLPEAVDFDRLKASLREENPGSFYDKLRSVGMEFGDAFQSLRRLWRGKNETLAELDIPTERYICHPLTIDAMIQSIFANENKDIQQLNVPVKIAQFTWFGRSSDSNVMFVHVDSNAEDFRVTLLDRHGVALARMTGVTLVPTTAAAIGKALESQRLVLPQFLEEEWIPLPKSFSQVDVSYDFLRSLEDVDCVSGNPSNVGLNVELKNDINLVNVRCCLQGLHALIGIGFQGIVGTSLEITELCEQLQIVPNKKLFVKRLFESLSQFTEYVEGSGFVFRITRKIPSLQELEVMMSAIDQQIIHLTAEVDCIRAVASKTGNVLRGNESVLPLLFGEGKLAETSYMEFQLAKEGNVLVAKTVRNLADVVKHKTPSNSTLRILEVGGGTGGSTREILPVLEESGVKYSYTFTDVSTGFFDNAEKSFQNWKEKMSFKMLDIEKDPRTQGFGVGEYDVVVACHVLHATRNMKETMSNVRQLLRPSGLVIISEAFEPIPTIDAIFGLVDGYWIFEDFDLRPYHCIVPETSWPKLLQTSDFKSHTIFKAATENSGVIVGEASGKIPRYLLPTSHSHDTWVVISGSPDDVEFVSELTRQFESHGRRVVTGGLSELKSELSKGRVEGILYVATCKHFDVSSSTKLFLEVLQTLLANTTGVFPKLALATTGALVVGDQGAAFPHNATLWGMSKSFRSENSSASFISVDLDPSDSFENNAASLLRIIWSTTEDFVAVRERQFFSGRLKKLKLQSSHLQLPLASNSALIFPKTNAISDLTFGTLQLQPVEDNDVEVEVKAAGLNFKDVLNVLKPTVEFEVNAMVGGDIAGVVTKVGSNVKRWKVGDRVVGCFFDRGGLPSHISVREDTLVKLPSNFSFEDGSTLPTVFMTSYHCLINLAQLSAGETVLVHTGSGGVGLAAIQVARNVGANVIATAGSKRKRRFLREIVGLENVFHSRDLSFADRVRAVTEGRGVDVVLNSLTGPGFKEASLGVVNPNGRFIEMSKLNIWSEDELKNIRPDVFYKIVDLTGMSDDVWKSLLFQLEDNMKHGKLYPLPYVAFESVEIRKALTYLQQARHIGKVVCRMPINVDSTRRDMLFNDKSTYLITGGLGGIGLEAARWMVSEGAKFIVLCGRNAPNDIAQDVIDELNRMGSVVIPLKVDIGIFEDCQRLLEDINEGRLSIGQETFPPLRGIHHAAGCLSDGTFPSQTWAKYETTFSGKVQGAWHLHQLTKNSAFPLEHFVLYSSMAATFGAPGQSNHAAGNNFLDALAHFRNIMGLPATSVNWGQWGQVGVAAGIKLDFCTPFTPLQGFASLKEILKSHKTQVAVVEVDYSKIGLVFPWLQRTYGKQILGNQSPGSTIHKTRTIASSEKLWNMVEAAKGDVNQIELIFRRLLCDIVADIIKMDAGDTVDVHANFQDIGLDSLMSVELKNGVQRALGPKLILSNSIVSDANNIANLASKIRELIFLEKPDAPDIQITSPRLD